MTNNRAQEIIERAMRDRRVYYDAVAARESEVWGKILPALEGSGARPADATASGSLRAARHQASLIEIAREKGLGSNVGLRLDAEQADWSAPCSNMASARASMALIFQRRQSLMRRRQRNVMVFHLPTKSGT